MYTRADALQLNDMSMGDMIGSLLVRYATKAILTTAANAALRGTLDAAKIAILHVIAF